MIVYLSIMKSNLVTNKLNDLNDPCDDNSIEERAEMRYKAINKRTRVYQLLYTRLYQVKSIWWMAVW